jgi:hypothetical protein
MEEAVKFLEWCDAIVFHRSNGSYRIPYKRVYAQEFDFKSYVVYDENGDNVFGNYFPNATEVYEYYLKNIK